MTAQATERLVGRYRVQRLLAEGGMGRVLLAKTEGPAGFTKLVVLKTLHPHLAADQGVLETFLVEARVSAALFHPNVAQVFELVQDGGEYFLAMEYVRGHSLRELLSKGGRLPLPIALSVTSQVLRALQHAHEVRDDGGRPLHVLHRDVSPENVLVSWEGAVKLVDFGLAGAKRRAGKVGYLAPEVLEGAPPSIASDLFAAGVLLSESLVGPPPVAALEGPWGPVVARALDPEPSKRFQSAAEFADALDVLARSAGHHVTQATLAEVLRETFGAPDEVVAAAPARRTALLTQGAAPPAPAPGPGGRYGRAVGLAAVAIAITALFAVGRERPAPAPSVIAPMAVAPAVAAPAPSPSPPITPVGPAAGAPPVPAPVALAPLDRAGAPAQPPERPKSRPKTTRLPGNRPGAVAALTQASAATLDLRVIPWAEVMVDGRPAGTTPLAPLRLAPGRHVVELKNPALGVSTSRTVLLEGGASQRLQVDLLDELDSK